MWSLVNYICNDHTGTVSAINSSPDEQRLTIRHEFKLQNERHQYKTNLSYKLQNLIPILEKLSSSRLVLCPHHLLIIIKQKIPCNSKRLITNRLFRFGDREKHFLAAR